MQLFTCFFAIFYVVINKIGNKMVQTEPKNAVHCKANFPINSPRVYIFHVRVSYVNKNFYY